MCFLILSYRQHPRYPLVLATNRDEFYQRPTAPAAFWEEAPDLLAGRDLLGGGTWLGVTRAGRYAALTNYREPSYHDPDAPTRGTLVTAYLTDDLSPRAYLERLAADADRYNGFNLLVGDPGGLFYFSNREGAVRPLGPGLYGLSNHLLDTPWPKVVRGKREMAAVLEDEAVDPEAPLGFLTDTRRAQDEALPDTGVGLEWERALSSIFIESPTYGTRCSTVVLVDRDGCLTFVERTYPNGESQNGEKRRFQYQIEPTPVY